MISSLVSVIIPAYNASSFLEQCLESVFAQSYSDTEILVIDDGSSDESAVIAKRYSDRVRFFSQEHMGISAARNRGVEEAQGEFFAFLDADDLCTPERLSLQVNAFEKDDFLDLVFGHMLEFEGVLPPALGATQIKTKPGCIPSTMMVKRSSFFQVGLFEPDIKVAEFLAWYLRAREQALRELMLPDLLVLRRIHGDNHSIRERKNYKVYAKLLKASLDRRRNQLTQDPSG